MTRIRDTYDYEAEDIRYDDGVVRDLDDKAEAKTLAMAQRNAAGTSPEVLSLMDAFAAGQKAGMKGWGPNMNDYAPGSPEHGEWERARSLTIGARLNSQRKVA